MKKNKKILLLTLKVFSATGGIEKVCRIAGKAMYEFEGYSAKIFSLYDQSLDINEKYFPVSVFKGFSINKLKFIYSSISEGTKNNVVLLSHINLLSIGYLIKILSPNTKLFLFAHGIEVWQKLPTWKLKMIDKCDCVIAVSSYTKRLLKSVNNIDDKKCVVINNCIDPLLVKNNQQIDNKALEEKYQLSDEHFILTTVTRISADEKYKGHDKVIEAISKIINQFPDIRYLIIGKYDILEKERLDAIIAKFNLQHAIIFTGFISDDQLPGYYQLADLFIMPSLGEGFGIAFIEAMYYGLPVIGGNKDGSTDALNHGKLGLLVDPQNTLEISEAIIKVLLNKTSYIPNNVLLMEKFGYESYKKQLFTELEILHNKN